MDLANSLWDFGGLTALEGNLNFLRSVALNDMPFLADAQLLSVIFMLLYFAVVAYGMILGDTEIQLMPLLRPFALGFVILMFPTFVEIIVSPLDSLTDRMRGYATSNSSQVEAAFRYRQTLTFQVATRISEVAAEIEQVNQEDTAPSGVLGQFGIDFSSIFEPFRDLYTMIMANFRSQAFYALDFVMGLIFKVAHSVIIFLQAIFTMVLIMVGPFSVAFSILPAYKSAFTEWIARFVAISFYTPMLYLVVASSQSFIKFCLEREIEQLVWALKPENEAKLLAMAQQSSGAIGFVMIAMLVTIVGVLAIPSMANWIVPTGGGGGAVLAANRGARMIGRIGR